MVPIEPSGIMDRTHPCSFADHDTKGRLLRKASKELERGLQAVKNGYRSCRESQFGSRHPCHLASKCLELSSVWWDILFWSLQALTVCTHTHTWTCVHTQTHIHGHTRVHTYVLAHTYAHSYMDTYTHIYTHAWRCVHMCIGHTYMYMHTQRHRHAH